MKILIDIGHPAHVHLFKHFAWIMQKKGHQILFTARDRAHVIHLLYKYNFNFITFGKNYYTKIGKIWGLFKFDILLLKGALKFKPNIFISHGSIYAAQVSFLLGKPHISLEDTFNFEQIRLYKLFTNVILTGSYNHPDLGFKNVKYNGYHELAYLHPNYFKPDKDILDLLRLKEDESFVIIRFVSWTASHDTGHKGIKNENKIKCVREFSKYAKVFISSERELPEDLKEYQIKISPERMHDAMAFASLLYGESATMASESAMLGVPSIFLDNTGRYYTRDLEDNYGLVFNFSESLKDQEKSIQKGIELLKTSDLKQEWQKRRARMLKDKIDVTAYMVWFIENYPESIRILKEDPDYQFRFK